LQLGLAGPILQVARTVIREVQRIATDRLREAFAEVPEARQLAQPVPAGSQRNESRTDEARRKGDLLSEKFLDE
jgi:hypothetical protein